MCGIAGIYAYHYAANAIDRAELRRIRDHMVARGPDGVGDWYSQDERVGLGHCRLTIIDLSERGAQPMMSANGADSSLTFLRRVLTRCINCSPLKRATLVRRYRSPQRGETAVSVSSGFRSFRTYIRTCLR
jgi:hypothetical protein